MRIRVFVSGPLSSSGDRLENVKQAAAIGAELVRRGYAPFVPHLSHYADPKDSLGADAWYETDLAWLVSSDAVLRFPGTSVGADREVALAERLGIPVALDADALDALRLVRGDARFHELLPQLGRLHDRKQADYGTDADPLANVQAWEGWGIRPWVGALGRAGDKTRRLQRYAARGWLANEPAEQDMLDVAVYHLIAYLLFREERKNDGKASAP